MDHEILPTLRTPADLKALPEERLDTLDWNGLESLEGRGMTSEQETLEANCVEDVTPLATVLQGERSSQVRDGLARLRDLDRETLEAFYVKGQSLTEMSDEFEAPLGTIKRRLHVARKRLAKEVEPMAV